VFWVGLRVSADPPASSLRSAAVPLERGTEEFV
jgi:hypothetical protein